MNADASKFSSNLSSMIIGMSNDLKEYFLNGVGKGGTGTSFIGNGLLSAKAFECRQYRFAICPVDFKQCLY